MLASLPAKVAGTGVMPQLVIVDQVLVAERSTDNPLHDQGVDRVLRVGLIALVR